MLGIAQKLPTIVYCNNQAAISLIMNLDNHSCTKHNDMKYFTICEYYKNNLMDFKQIHIND